MPSLLGGLLDKSVSFALSFNKLILELKNESRFNISKESKEFIDKLIELIKSDLTITLPAGSILYRARINEIAIEDREEEKNPFPIEKMGPPPRHLSKSGRINPEGISYLYCAESYETAGSEMRPWKGAQISIVEIETVKDLKIADFTKGNVNQDYDFFYPVLSESFYVQWPDELKINYLSTQFISESCKLNGYDGIKYKSALNLNGINYAIFNGINCMFTKTYTIETSEIAYVFYKKTV